MHFLTKCHFELAWGRSRDPLVVFDYSDSCAFADYLKVCRKWIADVFPELRTFIKGGNPHLRVDEVFVADLVSTETVEV